uniref:Uncharacterized protein n=1 Tax=Anguilla anguilla TaxID=7936 RepID=A0A0E9S7X6_ANGAN
MLLIRLDLVVNAPLYFTHVQKYIAFLGICTVSRVSLGSFPAWL